MSGVDAFKISKKYLSYFGFIYWLPVFPGFCAKTFPRTIPVMFWPWSYSVIITFLPVYPLSWFIPWPFKSVFSLSGCGLWYSKCSLLHPIAQLLGTIFCRSQIFFSFPVMHGWRCIFFGEYTVAWRMSQVWGWLYAAEK